MSELTKNKPLDIDIDLSYLRDVSGGSNEFMMEMIEIFLEQTPIYFKQLEQGLKDKNWNTVKEMAHKIKPTLAFMGVETARQDMGDIERKARNLENLEEIEADIKHMKAVITGMFNRLIELKNNYLSGKLSNL